jgi:hypothetical protein
MMVVVIVVVVVVEVVVVAGECKVYRSKVCRCKCTVPSTPLLQLHFTKNTCSPISPTRVTTSLILSYLGRLHLGEILRGDDAGRLLSHLCQSAQIAAGQSGTHLRSSTHLALLGGRTLSHCYFG